MDDMVKALKDKEIYPRIHVEDSGKITYAVSCRHCTDSICVKSCIAGCLTCVLSCPYGCLTVDENSNTVQKCELCLKNSCGAPACAAGCPNRAIVYEER